MLNSVLIFNRFIHLKNIHLRDKPPNAICNIYPKNELNYFIVVNLDPSLNSFQGELILFAQPGFALSTKHSSYRP